MGYLIPKFDSVVYIWLSSKLEVHSGGVIEYTIYISSEG